MVMSRNKTVRVLLSLAVLLSGCSKADFSSLSGASEEWWTQGSSRFYRTRQTILTTQSRPLDIIWVVDNSGSMGLEAAHVRTNISSFVQQLSGASDVKIALINRIGDSGTSTRLPQTSIPSLEIDYTISSVNALEVVASALCPENSLSSACVAMGSRHQTVRGRLSNFLRPNSQKILVAVTDDESIISETEFKAVYDSLYSPSSLTVFGWVGMGSVSPCQARTGQVYANLSSLTGGEVYNICDLDWSARFQRLASNVVTLAQDTIALPQEVLAGEFIKVLVNGAEVSANDYFKTSTGLRLSARVRAGLTQVEITIEYK